MMGFWIRKVNASETKCKNRFALVVTRCMCLRTPGTGTEMRGMRPGNTLLKPLDIDNQFLSHLWISFTTEKYSTKTIPSPILSKTFPKHAQLIQQTGKLKSTGCPQT